MISLAALDGPWKLVHVVHEGQTETRVRSFLFRIEEDPSEKENLAEEHPDVVTRLAAEIRRWRSRHPLAGTRGTLVPHPGWVPPLDWAIALQPAEVLQPRWTNELPFSKELYDATAERGVLTDEKTKQELIEAQRKRTSSWEIGSEATAR